MSGQLNAKLQERLQTLKPLLSPDCPAPTYRDIQTVWDLASVSSVHRVLNRLRHFGHVDWIDGKASTLHLVGSKPKAQRREGDLSELDILAIVSGVLKVNTEWRYHAKKQTVAAWISDQSLHEVAQRFVSENWGVIQALREDHEIDMASVSRELRLHIKYNAERVCMFPWCNDPATGGRRMCDHHSQLASNSG